MRLVLKIATEREARTPFWIQKLKMSRSDNMIWACPVFDDYDRAVEYAGDENLVTQVSVIE